MAALWSNKFLKMSLVLTNFNVFSLHVEVFHLVLANFNGFGVDIACFQIDHMSNCFARFS